MKPDVLLELKALRLHGMAGAWADLVEQGGGVAGGAGIESSRWLIEHLLQAEGTDRVMRSVSHQMKAAKVPVHRDMAGFDFEVSPVDRQLVSTLAAPHQTSSPSQASANPSARPVRRTCRAWTSALSPRTPTARRQTAASRWFAWART